MHGRTRLPAGGRELAGQVALVTGGAKNIGRAISIALASGRRSRCRNTLRSREDAETVMQEIRAAGGDAEIFSPTSQMLQRVMGEGVMKRFGKIDILVLNASQRREVLFKDMTFEELAEHDVDHTRRLVSLHQGLSAVDAREPERNIITLGGDAVLLAATAKRTTRRRRTDSSGSLVRSRKNSRRMASV